MAEIDGGEIDYKQRCAMHERTIAAYSDQLQDALRVIEVLVAVGKLKQGHVEEAKALVSSFRNSP